MTEAPHGSEIEQAFLGAVLFTPEILDRIEQLEAEHFYILSNRFVFEAMRSLYAKNIGIDELTVYAELKELGHGDQVQRYYITELINSAGQTRNAGIYAELIRRAAKRRELAEAAQAIYKLAMASEGTIDEITAEAENILTEAIQDTAKQQDNTTRAHMSSYFDEVEQRHLNGGLAGISTGYIEYDKLTNGLHEGDLTIVGARPSMGKTSLMINLGYNMAMNGKRVFFASCEMSPNGINPRLVAMQTGMDSMFVAAGKFGEEHWEKFVMGTSDLANLPLSYEYTPGLTLSKLRAICRREKRRHGLDVLMVDYIGLMQVEGKVQNRNEALGVLTKGLKTIAGEFNMPVMVASQLSREAVGDKDTRPQLTHLRDSGNLEQDADIVLFLHRPDYYNPRDKPGMTECIIAKQRNGPTGVFNLKFMKQQTKFVE